MAAIFGPATDHPQQIHQVQNSDHSQHHPQQSGYQQELSTYHQGSYHPQHLNGVNGGTSNGVYNNGGHQQTPLTHINGNNGHGNGYNGHSNGNGSASLNGDLGKTVMDNCGEKTIFLQSLLDLIALAVRNSAHVIFLPPS